MSMKIMEECGELTDGQISWLLERFELKHSPDVKSDMKKGKSTNSSKVKKLGRCKQTEDWVEVEYGETYKKVRRGEGY